MGGSIEIMRSDWGRLWIYRLTVESKSPGMGEALELCAECWICIGIMRPGVGKALDL